MTGNHLFVVDSSSGSIKTAINSRFDGVCSTSMVRVITKTIAMQFEVDKNQLCQYNGCIIPRHNSNSSKRERMDSNSLAKYEMCSLLVDIDSEELISCFHKIKFFTEKQCHKHYTHSLSSDKASFRSKA